MFGHFSKPKLNMRQALKRRLKIFFPALLGVALFGVVVLGFILPQTRSMIMNNKLEMIRELNHTAWSVLVSYEEQVRAGIMDRTEAEARAISRIRCMRYGQDGKDYFWINNLHPTMVMHPYRPELVDQDLSDFADPQGKKIFLVANDVVLEKDEGYVEYLWQWKDDPNRIEPKISYVKLFKPWQWVVGTGIYLTDVQRDIDLMRRKLLLIGSGVFLAVLLLAGHLVMRGLAFDKERKRMELELKKLACTDSLTGATNRRHFWSVADRELDRYRRYHRNLDLLLLDIDHFKNINDTYGHPAGDAVLRAMVRRCIRSIRKSDVFGRIGGEEFACLLVEAREEAALEVANRLRQHLADQPVVVDGTPIHYTVSIGIASVQNNDKSLDDMVKRADDALYRAKENGRNRVEVA